MKLVSLGVACLAALSLQGCAALNDAADFIDQPNVQQAAATVKTMSTALVCDISAGSQLALAVEVQAKSHTGITNTIDVASTAVCAKLQGAIVKGKIEKNVPAVTAVTTP